MRTGQVKTVIIGRSRMIVIADPAATTTIPISIYTAAKDFLIKNCLFLDTPYPLSPTLSHSLPLYENFLYVQIAKICISVSEDDTLLTADMCTDFRRF